MVSLRLIPKDQKFYDLFLADGENLLAAARELEQMILVYDRLDERVEVIRRLEHAGDEIDDALEARLENAFVTPFDREDIHELTARLDDVCDGIQEVAETFVIYGVTAPTPEAQELARILLGQAVELAGALRRIESLKGLEAHLRRIHELENQADGLSRSAIATLFQGGHDPLEVIKWRDIYHALEETIDAAEDAGEILERMLHKGT
jgi:predicted phosphate transport protein (TIGR00153 family)